MGPRRLWKTTIVVWSEFDPQRVPEDRLVREAVDGQAIITKRESVLVSSPYSQDDGPPEDFFDRGDVDDGVGTTDSEGRS